MPLKQSNPFCTRFTRPGSIAYQFDACESHTTLLANNHDLPIDNSAIKQLMDRLHSSSRALIVGPHGTGKTTLLRTLMPNIQSSFDQVETTLLHSPSDDSWKSKLTCRRQNAKKIWLASKQLRRGGGRRLLIIDGLEQLSAWTRWRLVWRANRDGLGLLATSHSLTRGLQVLHRTQATTAMIHCLTQALLANAPEELQLAVSTALAEREFNEETNVRELWFDLYDLVSESEQAQQSQSMLDHS